MILYTHIETEQVTVVAIASDNDAGTMVSIEMLRDQHGGAMLAARHIQMIDALCGTRPLFLWRSQYEMAEYIRLVRRETAVRVAANSVILPETMVALINRLGPVTPTTLRSALSAAHCCTKQALRKL